MPAKRSRQRQSSKSMYCMSTLNRFSLAKSVVGRALKLLGTSKRLLLCLPPIILMFLVLFYVCPKVMIISKRSFRSIERRDKDCLTSV